MIEADLPSLLLLGGFLGGLFGGSKTKVTTSTSVFVDVLVSPEIDVDVDVDTAPIAAEIGELGGLIEDLGQEQAALFVAALGGQSAALAQQAVAVSQQATAITGFGEDVGAGAKTLALAGLAAVAAFLFFGDGA